MRKKMKSEACRRNETGREFLHVKFDGNHRLHEKTPRFVDFWIRFSLSHVIMRYYMTRACSNPSTLGTFCSSFRIILNADAHIRINTHSPLTLKLQSPQSPHPINTMDRDFRKDDRRRPDIREHKPRYGTPPFPYSANWHPPAHAPLDRNRSRSRSPPRRDRDDRRRERSPFRHNPNSNSASSRRSDRDYDRDGPSRARSPPTAPSRRGGRAPARSRQSAAPEVVMRELEGEDEIAFLQRVMGFVAFRSTKNTKVPGNDRNYAVHKVKKAEYRQYMNRVGGFNRPLSPSRG